MFINNINPDILKIGPFTIRFYGIVYALGYLLITYLLSKKKIKNLTKEKALDITTYGLIFGVIGARIFHVLSDYSLYENNLLDVFAIWKGGLGFMGGLAGALVFVYYYCKAHKIELMQVLDVMAAPLALVIGFGRIANYINSEHLGYATNLPWCVVYEKFDMICRHPAQIYEAISMFLLCAVLFFLQKKWHKKGAMFWSFILGYGIARFTTDFFRTQDVYIVGFAHTQWISAVMIILGGYYLVKVKK